MESELTEEEYNALDLKSALEYTTISTYVCETEGCEKNGIEHDSASTDGPHEMIYANSRREDGTLRTKFMAIKSVCPICMVEKKVLKEKYFKEDASKYRVYTPKAKGDRSKNYYRDFSKTEKNTAEDPELKKNVSTKVSKADEAAFARNMKGKL